MSNKYLAGHSQNSSPTRRPPLFPPHLHLNTIDMSAGFALALCAMSLLPSALAATLPLSPPHGQLQAAPRVLFRNRQSFRSTTDNDSAVFQPDYVQRESWGLLAKYQQADVLLQGANLSPSTINNNQNGLLDPDVSSELPAATPFQALPLSALTTSSGAVLSYHATIEIGTPRQQLSVILDTGVADSWVATLCRDCDVDQFDSSKSATYRGSPTDFRQAYGVGYVWGGVGRDNMSVGGLTATTQSFGAVHDMDVGNAGYSTGVLGFAFGSVSTSKVPPFFETLIQQNAVSSPIFSLSLGRGGAQDNSELCLGCVNKELYSGNLTWLPLVSHTYWTLALTGLYVEGVNSMSNSLLAAIDTASNQIHVPMNVARVFYAAIPASRPATEYGDGFWAFPCNANLNLSLSFTGQPFGLALRDFNLGKTSSDSGECVGVVLGLRGRDLPDNFAVIGTAFLRSWYTVFDYSSGGRVGFGRQPLA